MTVNIQKPLFILMLVLLGNIGLPAQAEVTIKATKVSEQIYMLSGKGGNIGLLLGEDGSFVIDDQYANLSAKILQKIESLGGGKPRFLLNTHYHGDHTGGNKNMGLAEVTIVAHDNVRKRLQSGSYIEAFGSKTPPADEIALPVVTFNAEMHFHINDESVHVIHLPAAHTDGDSIIHFKQANVVHAGDIFFNGFFPFIDVDHGGTVRGVISAVDHILGITDNDSSIIPGHGPLANRVQLQAYRDMLDMAYIRLLTLKNQGVSVTDAIAQKPLQDLDAEWGDGFLSTDKWIGIVYAGVR